MSPATNDHTRATGASDDSWRHTPERSNLPLLRLMVWLSLKLGRRLSRLVLFPVAAYFLMFSPRAGKASQHYLRQALARPVTLKDRFLHIFYFATTIHDRLYLLNGRFDLFELRIHGEHLLQRASHGQQGLLLIGAHLGSFEVLRAIGRQHPELNISILMYQENARKINAVLEAINPAASSNIIPLGQMDSMLEAQQRLEQGHLIGMLADRSLGGDPTQQQPFLDKPAPFPLGPFRVAALLKRPVLFMTGLYMGGNRYDIYFEELADFTGLERSARDTAITAAQTAYAAKLTHFCRLAPYNWFNFFDFWTKQKVSN